jgi:cyclopropane fatty-acyl-phospholipid synthase-like methyltransferase
MTFDKVTAIEMAEHVGCANFVNPFLVSIRKMMSSHDSKFMLQVSTPYQTVGPQTTGFPSFSFFLITLKPRVE